MKKSSIVGGGNFEEMTKPGKKRSIFEVNFHIKMQCSWLNSMLVEGFSFPQEFKVSFEIRFTIFSLKKCQNIKKKIPGYFVQFGIFADISGYRQSQISLLIYLLLSVGKLQTQE